MRIDQFLWNIRYFKSRSQSTDACKKGKIKINNKIIKPSKEIGIGEIIEIRKKQNIFMIKISDIPKKRVGPKISNLYFEDLTDYSILKENQIINISKKIERTEKGRPTKKQRREIDNFLKQFYLTKAE